MCYTIGCMSTGVVEKDSITDQFKAGLNDALADIRATKNEMIGPMSVGLATGGLARLSQIWHPEIMGVALAVAFTGGVITTLAADSIGSNHGPRTKKERETAPLPRKLGRFTTYAGMVALSILAGYGATVILSDRMNPSPQEQYNL